MEIKVDNKKVSAIVCAYNEETTIRGVMQALANNPLIDEVIAIDDGSKDQTGIILNEFHNPDHVKIIHLPINQGKGYAMATAVSQAVAEILLFIDADLKNLSSYHVSTMLSTFIDEEADMVIGFPIRGKSMTPVERLDPFQHLSGQRILYRQDLLPLLDLILVSGYGVETILNLHYQEQGKRVKTIFLQNLIHPIKVEKYGLRKAIGEYLLEGKQILLTQIKNKHLVLNSFIYAINHK